MPDNCTAKSRSECVKLGSSSRVEVGEKREQRNSVNNIKQVQNVDVSGNPNSCLLLIGKQKYRSLCDSGAMISLIHERVFKALKNRPKLNRTSVHLQTAGHTSLNALGSINLDIKIGGAEMTQQFIVVRELNHNIILGLDWMKQNSVRMYFDLRLMRIQGKHYCKLEEDIHIARTVRMQHNVVLKPNSGTICYGKVREHPNIKVGSIFDVSQIECGFMQDEPGLQVINSVAKLSKNRTVPLFIVNNTNKFYKIHRHGLVARISSADDSDVCSVNSIFGNVQKSVNSVNMQDLDVSDQYRKRVENLILRNKDLFATNDSELGHTHTVKMKIDTGDHKPIKLRPYRTPIQNRKVIDKAVDEMLDAGVIKKSRSPWSFPVVIVDKKDGSKRFCVDFRKLNQITKKNSFPLPLIDDILALLNKSRFFTSLDLKSGYWQIAMDETDMEKTAFTVPGKGHYEWLKMPFGLSNAPALFQELMTYVLDGLTDFSTAYLDDILIFSETLEDHMKHLAMIFQRLRAFNLKLKLKKCSFLKTETRYLGFIINKDGIMPDQEKVKAIRTLPSPTCVREVRSFLGMTSYYRRFIPNFSSIAECLIALTRKHARFVWKDEHQQAFDYLKDSLTVVPLLSYPDPNLPYVLYTDASNNCVGGCLTQCIDGVEKPIFYLSHKLSRSQCKWSTILKEAYAIHFALNKLDYYLHNANFVIKTDHHPLKYLLESPMQNKKVQLWALTMAGYNCTIEFIPGVMNTCADLLSRHPLNMSKQSDTCTSHETSTLLKDNVVESDSNLGDSEIDVNDSLYQINTLNSNRFDPKLYASCTLPEEDKLQKADGTELSDLASEPLNLAFEQSRDSDLVSIKNLVLNGEGNKQLLKHHIVVDDILYYLSDVDNDPYLRLFVPSHLKHLVIKGYHDDNGHMGIQKTYDTIKRKYYWPNLFKEVHEHVSACILCQTRSLQRIRQPLQETDIPPYPFAKLSMDLSGPYPRTLSGNIYIISFVCHLTGWPECFAVKDKSAETIAYLILEEIFPRFGCCLQIVTDNGTEQCNRVVAETLKALNIDHVRTSVYSPQSNSKVERFHRTLHDVLAKKLADNEETWDLHLNQTLAAIRFNVSESSKYSPFFLLYGHDCVIPTDVILKPRRKYQGEELHLITLEEQHKAFCRVRSNLRKAKKRQAKYADRGAKSVEFKVGDPVFYKAHTRNKLGQRWLPYHRIIEKRGPVSYVILNQLTSATSRVHARDLRHAKIDEWSIPKTDGRLLRKAAYVVPPESNSSSDEVQSDSDISTSDSENIPLARLAERVRRERSDSSSEDDIPLMELSKRLKARDKVSSSVESDVDDNDRSSNHDIDLPVKQESAEHSSDDEMLVDVVDSSKVIPEKSKSENVKQLLNLIANML